MNRMLEQELPFKKIVDCGLAEYREFACSNDTFVWLRDGAMTSVDGQPVQLQIVDRAGPNVIVAARPVWATAA